MKWARVVAPLALGAVLLGTGCVGPSPSPAAQTDGRSQVVPFKRIMAVVLSNPPLPSRQYGGSNPGIDALEELVNVGLANVDAAEQLQAQLGEIVPTIENGLWRMFPDGRMELTWKLRESAEWHDGVPVTANDILFAARVAQDPEVPVSQLQLWSLVETVEAPDARTVIIKWKRPFYGAVWLFTTYSQYRVLPLPTHLLDEPYSANRAGFQQLPYWTEQFVGTGPYKVREWSPGTHAVLRANDRYVFGRPKLDEIVVRFVPNPTAAVAQILAGDIDIVLARGLSLDQAIQVRDNWKDGRVDLASNSWVRAFPQHLSPDPPIVADPRFKRALLRAIDRQGMADTLMSGVVPVAHGIVAPDNPIYPAVERNIVRYEYDPRAAIRGIEGLGYARGADGVFRDTSGTPLSVEIRTDTGLDIQEKSVLSVADFWRQIGVEAKTLIVPSARRSDREYAASFPGFTVSRGGTDLSPLEQLHTRELPLPENRFAGQNKAAYSNPQYDALIDRLAVTIPTQERLAVLGQILHHLTDQVVILGLFYDIEAAPVSKRLQTATVRKVQPSTQAWDVQEWDVTLL